MFQKAVIILIVVLALFVSNAYAKDFYDWTPELALTGENPGDGFTLWGSFQMLDRQNLMETQWFWDKEFNAFIIYNTDNYHINPGLGFRLGIGRTIGNFQPYFQGGVATVYNATEISSNLTNSWIHCTMRAGIDYIPWDFGIMVDHLSEPFEDDGGITTFGFVIKF